MSKSNAKAAAERLKNRNVDQIQSAEKEGDNQEGEVGSSGSEKILAEEPQAELSGKVLNEKPDVDKSKEELSQVEFVAPYKRYSKGDVAAFTSEVASELIEKKVAVLPGEVIEPELEPV